MTSPLPRWHALIESNDASSLESLFTEDAVFVSPALHTPQKGRARVCAYLRAAMTVLNTPGFRYIGEWQTDRSVVLEFENTLRDVYVNGVDMIRWNDDGLIVEFKVMIRPLKALNAVVENMAKTLAR
jgi:hypothetical protein